GSGFNDRALGELRARLDALAVDDDPFADAPPEPGRLHFVRPELVAEVEFANWTNDERLRAPAFVRLRDDKPPSEVVRADAMAAPPAAIEAPAAADRGGDTVADVLDQLGREGERMHLGVDGGELAVTNLDKVLWPETAQQRALTKRDLLRYLVEVSPWLLP
ncbi:MAG: ATP-dependent DNA ligase, partial [Chloroflexi bacterium]|nr:ATP-dependent DNA ligase [Chloroflexota bacterium]